MYADIASVTSQSSSKQTTSDKLYPRSRCTRKSGCKPQEDISGATLGEREKKKFPLNVSPTGGRDMFRVSYVSCTPRSQTYKVTNPFHPPTPSSQEILVPCFPFFIGKRNRGGGRADGEGRKRTDGIIFHLAPGFYANSLDGCAALAPSMFLLFFIPNKKSGRGKCRLGRKKQKLCQFVAAAAACCGSRSIRFLLFLSCSFFFTVASSSSNLFCPPVSVVS